MINQLEKIIKRSRLSTVEKIFWESRILPHLDSGLVNVLLKELSECPHLLEFYTINFMEKLSIDNNKTNLVENLDYVLSQIKQHNERTNI